MRERVLLVEDDSQSRRNIARFLEAYGYQIYEAEDGERAISLIREIDRFDVVISDMRMPGMLNGIDVIDYQGRISPGTRAVLITGFGSKQVRTQTDSMGVVYIEKPIVLSELLAAIGGVP